MLRHCTLVGTRYWAKKVACVIVVFQYIFYMAAVQKRFGIVEDLVQRYDDSENWFGRWEEEERRCEDDLSDFRNWQVQQQYSGWCSQCGGGPVDKRYGRA